MSTYEVVTPTPGVAELEADDRVTYIRKTLEGGWAEPVTSIHRPGARYEETTVVLEVERLAKSKPDYDAIFAANVKRERKVRRWSQADLAARLPAVGLTRFRQQTVAQVEQGGRTVRIGEAMAICEVFETSLPRMLQP